MAINLKGLGTGITKWASGVSWQLLLFKFLACGAILLVVGIGSYREGKADCQLEVATNAITTMQTQQQAERQYIREQLIVQQREIQERLKVINTQSREAQQLNRELEYIKRNLDEAINARPGNAQCAPTDDELRQYDEIAERSRNARSR